MVDQIYDRGYQAARSHLNASLAAMVSRAAKAALDAFAVLNRIEYGAPWRTEQPKARCN